MSLTTAFKDAVDAVFTTAGDLISDITYTRKVAGETDVFTDISDTETPYSIKAMVSTKDDNPYSRFFTEEDHSGDLSCIVKNKDFSFSPTTNDEVTYNSVVYSILRINDINQIIYIMTLEKKK